MLQKITNSACKKVINISENLLSEIHQIIYSLYLAHKIPNKVYKNKMNTIATNQNAYYYLWILKVAKHMILMDYHGVR